MSSSPRVTVLLPVFQGAAHVREAIDSILAQTFRDFELLILDDGSTDDTASIVNDCATRDPRIRVEHLTHRGLVPTLNHGLAAATGQFVARMDADDVSLPRRLERQVAFMDAHPEVGVCGTWVYVQPWPPAPGHEWRPPADHDRIRCTLLFESAVAHPTALIRRDRARQFLEYDASYPHSEDYDLWERAARVTHLANVPEVLLHLGMHAGQVTRRFHDELIGSARRVRLRQLVRLGAGTTPAELDLHEAVSVPNVPATSADLGRAGRWLAQLLEANRASGTFPEPAFTEAVREQWLRVCLTALPKRLLTTARYLRSPLAWPPRASGRVARELIWPAVRRRLGPQG